MNQNFECLWGYSQRGFTEGDSSWMWWRQCPMAGTPGNTNGKGKESSWVPSSSLSLFPDSPRCEQAAFHFRSHSYLDQCSPHWWFWTAPSNCEAEQTFFPLRCFCGFVVRAMKKATSDSLWINHLIKGLSVTWLYQGWIYKGKQTASAFLVRGSNFQRSPCEQMVV